MAEIEINKPLKKEFYEKSLEALNKAIEKVPGKSDALSDRIKIWGNLGKYEELLQDYDKLFQLDEREAGCIIDYRIKALKDLGRLEEVDKILGSYYDLLGSYNSNIRCDAAQNLLEKGGIDGIRWLVKALNSTNPNTYDAAIWAFAVDLDNHRKKLDGEQLKNILKEATTILVSYVEKIELRPGIQYLSLENNQTLNALAKIGDSSALPVLNTLLAKVTKRRKQDGFQKKYIQTEEYDGWKDNDSAVNHVKSVIDTLKRKY
jgi:tetratricopeptide (TPR) repeat protein